MRLISHASLSFKLQKQSEKPGFGASVINALSALVPATQNMPSIFPNLPVSINNLQTINDALSNALSVALTGNHAAVAIAKNALIAWNKAFILTANYVSSVAAGNETVIRSAGFVPTKSEKQPPQKPAAAIGFKVTINDNKGVVTAGIKKPLPGTKAYIYSAAPAGVTVAYNGNAMIISFEGKSVYIIGDTHKRTQFYNLPSGIPFNISMFGINSAGSGPAATSQKIIPQ